MRNKPALLIIAAALWLSTNLGSSLAVWATGIGAGLVMVVTVAAGIISVDMANIVNYYYTLQLRYILTNITYIW